MPKLNAAKFNEQRYAGILLSLNNFIELEIAHRLATQTREKELAATLDARKKEAFLVLAHSIDPDLIIPD